MRVNMDAPMAEIKQMLLKASIPMLFIWQFLLPTALACVTTPHFWIVFLVIMLPPYMLVVRTFRYKRINMIKTLYGFTDDPKSYKNMTPDESQAVLKNLAEWDSPFVFEFGWISEFFKVRADC